MITDYTPQKSLSEILEELGLYCSLVAGNSEVQLVLPDKVLEHFSRSFLLIEKIVPETPSKFGITQMYCTGTTIELLKQSEATFSKPRYPERTAHKAYYGSIGVEDTYNVECCMKEAEKSELNTKTREILGIHRFEFVKEQALAEKFFRLGYLAAHVIRDEN